MIKVRSGKQNSALHAGAPPEGAAGRASDRWLDAAAAARILGVKRETIYVYASRGLLHGVRRGRARYYRQSDVERHLQRSRARAGDVVATALGYGVPLLASSVTVIDEARGPIYRGHAAVTLATTHTRFESVAELLWDETQQPHVDVTWSVDLDRERHDVRQLMKRAPLSASSSAAQVIDAVLMCWALERPRVVADPVSERRRARLLLWRLVLAIEQASGAPRARDLGAPSIAAALLVALGGTSGAEAVAALNAALVVVADHELPPSTFCARIAASTGADLVSCLLAARAAHSGPRHGGACDQIEVLMDAHAQAGGAQRGATTVMRQWLERGERVPGFFREIYPHGDPRSELLLSLPAVRNASAHSALMHLGRAHQALTEDRTPPSVDCALVVLCRALSLHAGSATALFALSRMAGWMAHVFEQRQSAGVLRPRARPQTTPAGAP